MPVDERHFGLLKRFGRSALQKKIREEDKERLWTLACEAGGLPVVTRQEAIDEWKKFVVGESEHSRIALSPTVDKKFISIGVSHNGKLVAAHTTMTESYLRAVMNAYASSFSTAKEFLDNIEEMAKDIIEKKKRKR